MLSFAFDAALSIGSGGDYDAAKHWVDTYNDRRARAANHDAKAAANAAGKCLCSMPSIRQPFSLGRDPPHCL